MLLPIGAGENGEELRGDIMFYRKALGKRSSGCEELEIECECESEPESKDNEELT